MWNNLIENNGGLWSLIGILIALFTLYKVDSNKKLLKKFNKKNFKQNRMPENLESLKVISNNISSYLGDFENNKKNLKSEISKILPILKSLRKSLNPDEIDHYNTLKTSVKNIDKLRIDNGKIKLIKNLRVPRKKHVIV